MLKTTALKTAKWHSLATIAGELAIFSKIDGFVYDENELESLIISSIRQILNQNIASQRGYKQVQKDNEKLRQTNLFS